MAREIKTYVKYNDYETAEYVICQLLFALFTHKLSQS